MGKQPCFIQEEIVSGSRSGRRGFDPHDIEIVQHFLESHPDWSRQKLSMALCQLWRWKRLDGAFNYYACLNWLKRLEEKRIIRLPASRKPPLKKISFDSTRSTMTAGYASEVAPSFFSLDDLVVRPLTPAEKIRWRALMNAHHYLGFKNLVGESICYVATVNSEWVALLGWAAAAWKSCHREAWIGWNEDVKLKRLHLLANNVRFLILPGITVKNLASKVLALNLRRLSSDWERRYRHPILLVETFVDPARFAGTCYKAAGFFPLGTTKGFTKTRQGYVAHGQPRVLLIRPLHPKARTLLTASFLRVPQAHEEEGRSMIDVNQLPLVGEGGLLDLLSQLTDPRKPRGVRHPVVSILAMAVCAVLSGMKSFDAIAQWADSLPVEALEKLGCTRRKAPSEPTFRRVLQTIDAQEYDQKIGEWFAKQKGFKNKHVTLDGKTVRGSHDDDRKAIHLLSALLAEAKVVVAQQEVGEKTNEIPEVKPLLAPLPLEGAIVTGDAMHAQVETAKFVVEEKQADYLFTVKDNQPRLKAEIESLGSRLRRSFSPSSDVAG